MAAEGVEPCPAGLEFTEIRYSKRGVVGIHADGSECQCRREVPFPRTVGGMFEVPGSRLTELTGEIAWLRQRNADLTAELIAEREKHSSPPVCGDHLPEVEFPQITNLPRPPMPPSHPDYGTELILIFRTSEDLEKFNRWFTAGGGWEAFTGWQASQDTREEDHDE
jgi:hypothetical protein